MGKPAVDIIPIDPNGGVELRVRLDLCEEPLASCQGSAMEALLRAREELDAFQRRIAELEEQVRGLTAPAAQDSLDAALSAYMETSAPVLLSDPIPPRVPVANADRPGVADTLRAVAAVQPFVSTTVEAPPLQSAALPPAVEPNPPASRYFTDTLSGIEIDLGIAYKVERSIERLCGTLGFSRSSSWDDVDDTDADGSDVLLMHKPWYKRPGPLVALAAVTVVALLALGSRDWNPDMLQHRRLPSDVRSTAAVQVEPDLPAPAQTVTNLLAGTAFEKARRQLKSTRP